MKEKPLGKDNSELQEILKRYENLKKGRVPLQTFRSDIDFARERANLPLGVIGIKVWIYKGEIFAANAKK